MSSFFLEKKLQKKSEKIIYKHYSKNSGGILDKISAEILSILFGEGGMELRKLY